MGIVRHLALAIALAVAARAHAAELTVFAAASLSDALQALAPVYRDASGDTLRFNFGSSGALARQIKEGAPADVIVSADELRVDQLEKAGLIAPGTRRTVLANQLVVVVPADASTTVATLADLKQAAIRRIALGDPATVPAGTYTKEHLEKIGLWPSLLPKCVPVDNVRAVLAAVASGNADAGFVYRTDALISKQVTIAVAIPLAGGPRITYPAAAVKDAKSPAAAAKFVAWLSGDEARKVFAKFGFLAPQ